LYSSSVVESFVCWCHSDLSSEHLEPLPWDIHAVGIEDKNYPYCACGLQSCPALPHSIVVGGKWPGNFRGRTTIEQYGDLTLKIRALQIAVSLFRNIKSPTNKY